MLYLVHIKVQFSKYL